LKGAARFTGLMAFQTLPGVPPDVIPLANSFVGQFKKLSHFFYSFGIPLEFASGI
jgi:hypothetical protein